MNNQNSIDQPVELAYLAGASYCGSTLLSFILNTHPQILSIGEMGPPQPYISEDFRCSCGAKIIQCPFIQKVKKQMSQYGVELNLANWQLRHQYSSRNLWERVVMSTPSKRMVLYIYDNLCSLFPNYTKRMRECNHRNEVFIRSALEVSGKSIFVDATKIPVRFAQLAGLRGINLKIIHLVRDPRGFCYSNKKYNNIPLRISAEQWIRAQISIENYIQLRKIKDLLLIQYEAFCSNPKLYSSKIFQFLGVHDFSIPDNFRSFEHHIIGNKMRLSSDSRKTIQLDEKWRDSLSAEDLAIVARVAGPLARKYGYSI
ncbi:MAG: sulfotransferase [Planctomycetota bacterium]